MVKSQTAIGLVWLLTLCLSASSGLGEESQSSAAATGKPGQAAKAGNDEPVLTGQSVALPGGTSEQQLREVLRLVGQQIQSAKGYSALVLVEASSPEGKAAAGFDEVGNYDLTTSTGARRILQIGVQLLETQADHLFVQGYEVGAGEYGPNPDIEAVVEIAQTVVQGMIAQQKELRARDLSSRVYPLNYVGADQALAILKVLGYTIIDAESSDPNKPIDPASLPYVCKMPDPEKVWLEGTSVVKGPWGMVQPGGATQEFRSSTTGGPLERLLIIYDPNRLRQNGLSRLLELLSSQIDVAARQLLIEGMVLEVSETGIRQLGVEWDVGRYDAAGVNARAGATFLTPAGETTRAMFLTLDSSIEGALSRWSAVLRVLIRDGEAQVLSRPSILALDNRQARIRVTTEVPVSSTVFRGDLDATREIKVQYISVGIILNIRPRMSSSGEDVSFQIDASVSDIDLASPFRIQLDIEALAGAQAPVVLTRQVQTSTRIRNNTPLIIGGLIAKRSSTETDRIPFLSDIPILGWLFKVQADRTERREVIIVLTPYVLPEKTAVSRAIPKDSEYFDEIDPILFRATYRIRIQDVFDLSFLRNNAELTELTAQAKALVQKRPELASRAPFEAIVSEQVPGETILVERMIYQIIKKLKQMEKVTPSNLILFKENLDEPAGFEVQFLTKELTGGRSGKLDKYFKKYPKRALALIFRVREKSKLQDVLQQPIPEIQVLELKNRDEWGKKLYELNQPVNGVQRWSILINSAKDIARLQAALILKRTIDLNQTDDGFQLKHFQVGRQLAFPVIDPERTYLIGPEVARYFYHTEHYYAAFLKELTESLAKLRAEISRLENTPEPSGPGTKSLLPELQ